MEIICERVRQEAIVYKRAGVDSILVENMHDLPYLQGKDMGPETVACMTRACLTAKEALQGHGHTTQDKTLVHSLKAFLQHMPDQLKKMADNAVIAPMTIDGKHEMSSASFPDFKEIGIGKSPAEAKLKGILHICANCIDKEHFTSEEMSHLEQHIQSAKSSEIHGTEERILKLPKNYNEMKFDWRVRNFPAEQKFRTKLSLDGKLVAEGTGQTKRKAMTNCVKEFLRCKIGVQILAGANHQAMAVAKAAGLDFIRAEGFIYSHVADEGWMDACAGALLRYRSNIYAKQIQVFTDIKKKHSAHAVTSDVSLAETAEAAELFGSDGLIVTGTATGMEADPEEVKGVVSKVNIPVLVGSGVNLQNVDNYKDASGYIVGSHFKVKGQWRNRINIPRLYAFMVNSWSDFIDFDTILLTEDSKKDSVGDKTDLSSESDSEQSSKEESKDTPIGDTLDTLLLENSPDTDVID
nr:uncharacterized protein LOC111134120 isoform X2 [Crassostrea virginica]